MTIRGPRRQVVKPTSASRRSVPWTTSASAARDSRSSRHASQGSSKVVASGPSQTCCRSITGAAAASRRAAPGAAGAPLAGAAADGPPRSGPRCRRCRARGRPRRAPRAARPRRARPIYAPSPGTSRRDTSTTSPTAQSRRSSPRRARAEPSRARRQVGELGVALLERELLDAGGAAAVLREEQLGDAGGVGLFRVVVLVAVDEHHQVGVLLDRARLAQVGEDRPLVMALLDGARQLGQRDDRYLEVASEHLQGARDLRDLLDTV